MLAKERNAAMPNDLPHLTATRAVRLIQDGKLRPKTLMDADLDRVAEREPTVLAFTHIDAAQPSRQELFNLIWTSPHVPCITVPAGTGPNGLPLVIQIIGRRGDDRAVLPGACWVEAAIA
jgi:Asp-tRNA(Asn)/Glu-tRNA(Gln) amidotransferase A subunit family amidase